MRTSHREPSGYTVSPLGVDDADAIEKMAARCGARSLERRLLGIMHDPGGQLAGQVRDNDPAGRVDLGARIGPGVVVGLGSLVPLVDGSFEVALLVEDVWQRRGVGAALVRELVLCAAQLRVDRVRLSCAADGLGAVRALLASSGWVAREYSISAGVAEFLLVPASG